MAARFGSPKDREQEAVSLAKTPSFPHRFLAHCGPRGLKSGSVVTFFRITFTELKQLPMPTIAAIEGATHGGGIEMALACDFRVAGAKAVLGFLETSLGILPGAGGTQRLPRLIGVSKVKELVFTGRRLNASEAEKIGLVNYAVPEGSALGHSLKIAREILPNSPIGVRMTKETIARGSEVDIATGMAIENACYTQIATTKVWLEGLLAFKEKCKPQYKGE